MKTPGKPLRTGYRKRQIDSAALPMFCDFSCPHASFSPADATGACRREQAVRCILFGKFNNKHAICLGRR
jgi:hypothetical protein